MKKPKATDYIYYVISIGKKKDPAYKAAIPKFPQVDAYGNTPQELHEGVIAGIEVALEEIAKNKKTPPQPDKKSDFTGKILLRLRPQIHEEVYYKAQANNLSVNKYIEKQLSQN